MKNSISAKLPIVRKLKPYSLSGLKLAAGSIILFGALSSCIVDDPEIVSDIKEDFIGIKSVSVEGAYLDVSYVGNSSTEIVNLEALMRANSNSRAKINYSVKDDKLIIEVKSSGGSLKKSDGYIRLTGPKNITVDLNVSSGNLYAETIKDNQIKLSTSSGKIHAKNLEASYIRFFSSSGEVLGEGLTGKVSTSFSSGKVHLYRIDGSLSAEGSSGNLLVKDLIGKIDAKISSGKIDLDRINELGKLIISSGSITGHQIGLGPSTELTASSGNISIQTNSTLNSFNFDLTAASGRVRVGNSSTAGTLKINNGAAYTIKGLVGSGKIEIFN
ncbi:MAG TPA: DUF4097 family beta strand repeat-containing protein [Anditalea sp.]|nr:DUF4097 family beta strand repeat-containing protein [Anditalea sp.]